MTIDRETLKVLSSDTRLDILKSLSERKKTVTELAENLNLSKSTVHEHLKLLTKAGLVKRIDTSNKWVYYGLTWKGFRLIQNNLKKVILMLSIVFLSFIVGIYEVKSFMFREPIQRAFRTVVPTVVKKGLQHPTPLPLKETAITPIAYKPLELLPIATGVILIGVGIFFSFLLLRMHRRVF